MLPLCTLNTQFTINFPSSLSHRKHKSYSDRECTTDRLRLPDASKSEVNLVESGSDLSPSTRSALLQSNPAHRFHCMHKDFRQRKQAILCQHFDLSKLLRPYQTSSLSELRSRNRR